MAIISKTKWLTMIAAFPIGIYGFFLSLGAGPDGPHLTLIAHVAGVLLLTYAIASFIPNSQLLRDRRTAFASLGILNLPFLLAITLLLYGVAAEGVAKVFESGARLAIAAIIGALLPAPVSFALAWIAKKPFEPTSGSLRDPAAAQR